MYPFSPSPPPEPRGSTLQDISTALLSVVSQPVPQNTVALNQYQKTQWLSTSNWNLGGSQPVPEKLLLLDILHHLFLMHTKMNK